MGCLKTRETERIGAGPAGFLQIQKHKWFDGIDWEATLRRDAPAPWIPPHHQGGAADGNCDFTREDVRSLARLLARSLARSLACLLA